METHTEIELFRQIAEGDEAAFTTLFKAYAPQLTPFILGITKSPSLVDEMIQETFVRLWINRDRLAGVTTPGAWIFGITSHICYSWLRRKITERKVFGELEAGSPHSHEDTGEYLHLKEIKDLLQQAIGQLPPQRQKIYRLSREQEMKIPEIAEHLGISAHTVKNTLVTALQTIRQYIADAGHIILLIIIWLINL